MKHYVNAYINLKIKDINNIFIKSINNIKNKVVSIIRKDKFLSKTSLR